MSGKELYILDFAEQDIPAGALLVDSIKQKVSSIMQMNIINCYHHGLSSWLHILIDNWPVAVIKPKEQFLHFCSEIVIELNKHQLKGLQLRTSAHTILEREIFSPPLPPYLSHPQSNCMAIFSSWFNYTHSQQTKQSLSTSNLLFLLLFHHNQSIHDTMVCFYCTNSGTNSQYCSWELLGKYCRY